ncbi:hypothetical protein ACJJTC_006790 [Scirpophaga incertulas]
MQTADSCNVCGSTETNLIDGFYYCAECGTQDLNVKQTVIEEMSLADGTFGFRQKKRVLKATKDKVEMSPEWHKWHTYNFMLAGLADKLIEIGAEPSFKKKLLWIWTKYIKMFQNKDELGLPNQQEHVNKPWMTEHTEKTEKMNRWKKGKENKLDKHTRVIKKSTITSMLYLALNLDGSHIQLSDLHRFIRENHIDIEKNWREYVSKDIKFDCPTFNRSHSTIDNILEYSSSILCCLNIPPRFPDMRKLVDKYVKELCLPKKFKKLVLALMYECPCDYLEIDKFTLKDRINFPNYECTAMSYIVVAFKMCFGLDDDYEVRLSEAVEKINDENCYLKSYRFGTYSQATDRLFSFREWCHYIQLRKFIICKYNLYFAEEYNVDSDDYISLEHSKGIEPRKKILSDELVMNLLDKLELVNAPQVMSKSKFKPTTTPLTTYTNLISEHLHDPNLKLLLSEDFSRYSLKYACRNLCLSTYDNNENIVMGIDETNKYISNKIVDHIYNTTGKEIVFVRNCNNKNWLTTLQPTIEHYTRNEDMKSSKYKRDPDCDFNSETAANELYKEINISTDSVITEDKTECKTESNMLIEDINNIFDDDFKNLKEENLEAAVDLYSNSQENIDNNDIIHSDSIINNSLTYQDSDQESEIQFNPETFDRDKIIREIILAKCKKHAIQIPAEYNQKEPRKRKSKINDDAGVSKRKKSKFTTGPTKSSTVQNEVDKLLTAYYESLQHDVLFQISEHVKSVVGKVNIIPDRSNSLNEIPNNNNTLDITNQGLDNGKENDSYILNTEALLNEDNITGDKDSVHNDCVLSDECNNDPMFDEKEYNINQLYIKVETDDDYNNSNEFLNDNELTEIVDRIIERHENRSNSRVKQQEEIYDSEDDIPLSVIMEEKMEILKQKERRLKTEFKPLINNTVPDKFNYWTRHYHPDSGFWKSKDRSLECFQMEIKEKFPRSFSFVLTECAHLISGNIKMLYTAVISLEQRLLDQ